MCTCPDTPTHIHALLLAHTCTYANPNINTNLFFYHLSFMWSQMTHDPFGLCQILKDVYWERSLNTSQWTHQSHHLANQADVLSSRDTNLSQKKITFFHLRHRRLWVSYSVRGRYLCTGPCRLYPQWEFPISHDNPLLLHWKIKLFIK